MPPSFPVVSQPPVQVGNTRIIQNKGIYVFDENELTAWRLRVLVDVIEPPAKIYESLKPNEPERYFGVFQIVEGGFVISQHNLKFTHQQVYRYQNDPAKALFDSTYAGLAQTFNLYITGTAILNAIPNGGTINVSDYARGRHLATPATEIWFRTANGAKIAVHTEYLPLPEIGGQPASIPEPAADASPSAPSNPGGNGTPPADAPPPAAPTPPYNPENGDNGRTTPPGTGAIVGQWYNVYVSYGPGCVLEPEPKRYLMPGCTNGAVRPIQNEGGQGTCGGDSKRGTVTYGGVLQYEAVDYVTSTFEFVAAGS